MARSSIAFSLADNVKTVGFFYLFQKKKGTGAAHRNAEADAAVARREHQEAAGDAAEQGPG